MLRKKLTNPFLQLYLEYVEDTESPRIMHIWSALSGAGACLGRRVYMPFGVDNIYGNMYVLLVGPPGSRKSTAVIIMQKLIRRATRIRMAPEDTGGQRQGLIVAMEGTKEEADKEEEDILAAAVAAVDLAVIGNTQLSIDPRDQHVMYAIAEEFASLIGRNAGELITFLIKVYDGRDYDYRIRNAEYTLENPLLSIIGGTTPATLQDCLPTAAIGHGFTSRIIFVYGNKRYKAVPRPQPLPERLGKQIEKVFSRLFYDTDGEIQESKQATELINSMYERPVKLSDPRFMYYLDRRQKHMLKLSLILAVARGSMVVDVEDVHEADFILKYTEAFMPEALGEYGLSPISAAKQKMVEFLQHAKGPVTDNILWAVMERDMRLIDWRNSLMELVNAGKIAQVQTNKGVAYIYRNADNEEIDNVLNMIAE